MSVASFRHGRSPDSGMILDCGSGHTSILWYSRSSPKIRQLRRSKLKLQGGGNFKITDIFESHANSTFVAADFITRSAQIFADALRAEIEEALTVEGIPAPDVILIGATGGLRNMLGDGRLSQSSVSEFERVLVSLLQDSSRRSTRFAVITGEQEAAWELAAAHLIYGPQRQAMFPAPASEQERKRFGLFSGGGSSMQMVSGSGVPLSFPFSTWCGPEMDEALGAANDAWKDPAIWARWQSSLVSKIQAAKASLEGGALGGCYVLTAMNHVAASAAGFAEAPIRASEASARLAAALAQFRAGSGEPFESFVNGGHSMHPTVLAWYSSQPPHHLARVGAMHICRLMLVIDALFEPEATLFAPAGTDATGVRLDCEWTLEAFAREVADLDSPRRRGWGAVASAVLQCLRPSGVRDRSKNRKRRPATSAQPGPGRVQV